MSEDTRERIPEIRLDHHDLDFGFRPYNAMMEVVGKDKNFEYRHVRNTPQQIRYREKLGYELVTKDDGVEVPGGTVVDGRLVCGGEHVLMKRHKSLTEKHLDYLKKKAARSRMGPNNAFKNQAKKHNVEVVDRTKFTAGPLGASTPLDDEDEE